jgi:adenine-specific DNA-methyltransferase
MRFIGSKINLLSQIEKVIKENVKDDVKSFTDIFSGTGVVGEYFKKNYRIISNDLLYFSYIIQKAKIENNTIPDFKKLRAAGIDDPLFYLENESYSIDSDYFITHNFSPYLNNERMYLSVKNAGRIDFIRITIERWKNEGLLNENEYAYLLAVLIEAVPFISNISGTYGAYLKHWDKRALGDLKLRSIDVTNNEMKNRCYNEDANKLIKRLKGDILYIDPPYNGRQYISNYHLLETIARYDNPVLYGKTGLRTYEEEKSKYCIRSEVSSFFEDLIKNARFRHIIVSYSSDGLLSESEIKSILIKHGIESTYRFYKLPYRKYKSKHKQESNELYEYLFYIRKDIDVNESKGSKPKNIKASVGSYKGKGYIKSPLNYIGGKYRLLKQIMPLFPSKINKFVDLFAGGFNVGINTCANVIYANDINTYVIEILKAFRENDLKDILSHIERRINEFSLSKYNEEGFLRFRDFYNRSQNPLDLYTLICYSFNYQLRFNNSHEYNNPFGRNRSHFSDELKQKLIRFIEALKSKEVIFSSCEFENFCFDGFDKDDLVYCDPPYLITTGSYNDGNRGFKDWNAKQENKLLELLDSLNERGIRFALSNVLTHKGDENSILINWAKKYNVHYLDHDYSNSSHNTRKGKSEEVLITNYLTENQQS